MEIIKDTRNELFKRTELKLRVAGEKTPSFAEVKKMISEELKKDEGNIEVRSIYGKFGKKLFEVNAYVYDSKEGLEKAVQKSRKQRREEKKAEEERKKAEAEAKKVAKTEKQAEAGA